MMHLRFLYVSESLSSGSGSGGLIGVGGLGGMMKVDFELFAEICARYVTVDSDDAPISGA